MAWWRTLSLPTYYENEPFSHLVFGPICLEFPQRVSIERDLELLYMYLEVHVQYNLCPLRWSQSSTMSTLLPLLNLEMILRFSETAFTIKDNLNDHWPLHVVNAITCISPMKLLTNSKGSAYGNLGVWPNYLINIGLN